MKTLRTILAALSLPLVCGLMYNTFMLIVSLGRQVSDDMVPFWLGLAGYFIFQGIFAKPIRTYVFGHELTHALVGLLSGARLKSFNVSTSGGSVVLTKTNIWITLSPYFVPIYTVALMGLYWVCHFFWPLDPYYGYVLFAAGFTLSFHFSLTHYALGQGQSDLKAYGPFFSGVLILFINCLVIAGVLKLLFPSQIQLGPYLARTWITTAALSGKLYEGSLSLWSYIRSTK